MAAQIDMKKIDEQLDMYLNRVWSFTKKKDEISENNTNTNATIDPQWELDARNLTIKAHVAPGTYGSIYRGIYDGREVAVKVFDLVDETKRCKEVFMREVSLWTVLDHPNITKLVGAVRNMSEVKIQLGRGQNLATQNACCIVAEYLPGGTLKSYLLRNRVKKLQFNMVIQLALEIGRGLRYLHSKHIIHRDVKTENILLDKKHRVKLTDFGVSRFEGSKNSTEMMNPRIGTLGYMAPEVLNGSWYDHKCDVYSFGICLWEIYCCSTPYPDLNTLQETSIDVYNSRRPEIPRSCPSSLADVMEKCWDIDPRKRPEMEQVVLMLEAIEASIKQSSKLAGGCFCFLRQHSRHDHQR